MYMYIHVCVLSLIHLKRLVSGCTYIHVHVYVEGKVSNVYTCIYLHVHVYTNPIYMYSI